MSADVTTLDLFDDCLELLAATHSSLRQVKCDQVDGEEEALCSVDQLREEGAPTCAARLAADRLHAGKPTSHLGRGVRTLDEEVYEEGESVCVSS